MKKGTISPPTRSQQEDLEALAALPEEAIDTSDAPEVTDWRGARRGVFYRPVKQQITLRLDADLIAWFKATADQGKGYQTQINRVLREYMARRRKASKR